MARVSVIVPCYNDAAYLREALQSALAQTRPVDEVLVVDDGSTDDSAAIARSFGGPVRVIAPPKNLGPAGARNLGIQHAAGDLIAFLDADDYWAPTHIATLERLLADHPDADIAFSRVQLFGDHSNQWWATIAEGRTADAFWECVQRVIAQPSGALVRAVVVKETARFDARMRYAEDFDFWLRVSVRHRFVCTYGVTAYYRKYPEQHSRNLEQCKRAEFVARRQFWDERVAAGDSPEFLKALRPAMQRAWEAHLLHAYRRRSRELFAFYLSLAETVPDAEPIRRLWARRGRWMWFLRFWDLLPKSFRRVAKTVAPHPAKRPSVGTLPS